MKLLKATLLVILFPLLAIAQNPITVTEGSTKMGKEKMWTFSATYKYGKGYTDAAMYKNLEDAGMKRSGHKKGVSKYKAASWPAISATKGDYYYRIRTKKGKSTVYIAASKGYDNFVTGTNDEATAMKLTKYLQDLDGQIANDIAMEAKQKEIAEIAKRNEELNKELKASKEQEAQKAKELNTMRKMQTAPAPVK
jgi:hypothetical protein